MFGRTDDGCRCETGFEGDLLVVESGNCPGRGRLADAPGCLATVVDALRDRDAVAVRTRAAGLVRAYEGEAAALLVAAGRFVDAAAFHDEALAARATRDPLRAAHQAVGRAGAVARIAAETGMAELAARSDEYATALRPSVAPAVARERVATALPSNARLRDRYDLDTGATVRIFESDDALRTYHLTPTFAALDEEATAVLADAHERLASGAVTGGPRAPGRAVRAVAPDDAPVETLSAVLHRHTLGFGVFEHLFGDGRVSDVFATAPVTETPLRVRADGEVFRTNVRLTADGAAAFASRLRQDSGRPLSRATPTLDATASVGDRDVRIAAVTDPVSDGYAFALRAHDADRFTLPDLVANGTLPPDAAALCSVAVARGAAVLLAGGRGAGKTTLLGALVPELPSGTRTVVIEDTPELPVETYQAAGRDVQRLHVSRASDAALGPTEALRAALRLGEGALVVGEVRGEEAAALYESMRVGAAAAVLGTVHGENAAAVRERVVTDLGVPASSFASTDLVVTCARIRGRHRVIGVEEVVGDDTAAFASLFEHDDGLVTTGRIDRGESHLLASLAAPTETYADVRAAVETRHTALAAAGDSTP